MDSETLCTYPPFYRTPRSFLVICPNCDFDTSTIYDADKYLAIPFHGTEAEILGVPGARLGQETQCNYGLAVNTIGWRENRRSRGEQNDNGAPKPLPWFTNFIPICLLAPAILCASHLPLRYHIRFVPHQLSIFAGNWLALPLDASTRNSI